jgi:hypothetical protein
MTHLRITLAEFTRNFVAQQEREDVSAIENQYAEHVTTGTAKAATSSLLPEAP